MSQPKWKAERFKRQAEEHWNTVPDYDVATESDSKVDEHPQSGVGIYS